MEDEPGRFTSDWLLSDDRCVECFGPTEVRLWESSNGAHEDVQHRCLDCGHTWWTDGIDA